MAGFSRRAFLGAVASSGALACGGAAEGSAPPHERGSVDFSIDLQRSGLRLAVPGFEGEVRVCLVADPHLALRDARDAAHRDFCSRMAQWPGSPKAFSAILARARTGKSDLVALVGDIISFPTLANVEFVARELEKCGVDWMYTAGNHDWDFEGDAGSDAEKRERWIARRLGPLYRGAAPLMSSKVVKGVRFVAIDNSTYNVTPEQLAFWRKEAAKPEPVVLLMHIPLWFEGFGVCTCGNQSWGAATDRAWRIERRERWAERQSRETFEFREAVLSARNLVAVFTGHEHRWLFAGERGRLFLSIPKSAQGFSLDVRFVGTQQRQCRTCS